MTDGSVLEGLAQELQDALTQAIANGIVQGLIGYFGEPERAPEVGALQGRQQIRDARQDGETTTGWRRIDQASFKSGRVTRTISKGSPVKVKGLGRGGGIGSGYAVTGLETRDEVVNVHVRKGREQERTVRLDRIIYVIPKRG